MCVCCQVCAELEHEKRKHAQDTAQGDDVTYMLEKDRERLKQEVMLVALLGHSMPNHLEIILKNILFRLLKKL